MADARRQGGGAVTRTTTTATTWALTVDGHGDERDERRDDEPAAVLVDPSRS
jgi:hypothetical protein